MKQIHVGFIAGLLLAIMAARPVLAQDAATILARIDSVLNAPADRVMVEKMTLIDKNGSQKVRKIKFYQKGSELRLVRFLSPADVRGVAFLRRAEDRLYLYLPAFRRIRRIASSIKNERFMGTDFTYEDMSQSEFSRDYRAERLPDAKGQYVLQLTPLPDADVSYGRLVVYADRSNYVYRKVEYYGRDGKLQKQLLMSDIQQVDGYWVPKKMEMRDVRRNHKTILELLEVKFDQGLSDKLFTQRNLKRPVR